MARVCSFFFDVFSPTECELEVFLKYDIIISHHLFALF